MNLQEKMFEELKSKAIFEQAQSFAYTYSDQINDMDVFPSSENIENLINFDEPLPEQTTLAAKVMDHLNKYGGPATIAQTGGKYFGFVNGGAIPVSIATKWLTDFWDQCGGLYLTSPINAKLEVVCEQWLKELFNFPQETVAGFVSGTSMANLCALAAARFRLLNNLGWDLIAKGLNGAPPLKIIAHQQSHSSITKSLSLLGFGKENIHWVESDEQGRMRLDKLPPLDNTSLVILQAGNVNTGAFDPFDEICEQANKVGAWVHIDGAFGLWAGATKSMSYLTKGMEKASSWAVDGHKTLNTPYDSGIILCKDADAMINALQATADYIILSDQRDPLLFTPEMSKRARAIELWATMKYLGRTGIDEMVTSFHLRAKQLEKGLKENGFSILNEVVYNQVLIACDTPQSTKQTLSNIQQSKTCWCAGTNWNNQPAIRMSICSWATTVEDIDHVINVFIKAKQQAEKAIQV